MAKRTAAQTGSAAFPPLGLVATPGPGSGPVNGVGSLQGAAASDGPGGLPPAPSKFDASQAQQCRLQDAYWSDEEEDMDCPLCLEEIDLSDANFKPCPCGYQICRFCWHHIKQNLNGRCPACRRKYSDQTVEFKPMTAEEIKRLTQAKKQKERERKELEAMNRKHLANMRVVQKNLVYVVGLNSKLAKEELIPTLRSNEYFGQYGRISKILISKRTTASKLVMGTSESALGVYVTYHRKEDAARAIVAIDGSKGSDGKIIRASYGTTKYCTTYLRNLPCTNPGCTYLHEPGEEADSFTKEDLSTLRHAAKDTEHKVKPLPIPSAPKKPDAAPAEAVEASALPKTASWASGKAGIPPIAPIPVFTSGLRDADMPPLSASAAIPLVRKPSSSKVGKTPSSPSPARSVATPSAPKSRLATVTRPEAPAPPGLSKVTTPSTPTKAAPLASTTDQSPKLGFAAKAPGAALASEDAPAEVSEDVQTQQPSQAPSSHPSAPPGLAKAPPPGLAPSPAVSAGAPDGESAPVSPTAAGSSYQPSSSAQALLDDMRSRREAEPEQPQPSPFPDFDDALSSFRDGEFSFNFPRESTAGSSSSSATGAFGTFSPFGIPPGIGPHHGLGHAMSGTPPPGISRTPNRSATASPAPHGAYSGSFDPFAPGAGETIRERTSSPFAAIEQMQRTLSEDPKRNGSDEALSTSGEGGESSRRASRFGFAKRKESGSFGAGSSASQASSPSLMSLSRLTSMTSISSPASSVHAGGPPFYKMNSPEGASGYAERHRSDMYNDQDPLALSKDVSGILGSMFDNEPQQHPSSGLPNGYGAEEFSGRESGFPGGPHGISRPPGIAGMGQSSFGTNTPPPGIAAPAHRQGALGMQMGGAGDSQQQQHPQLNGSAAWFAELQQQSQARGQYGAQGSPAVEHRQNGPAGAYSGVNGHAGGSDPLLAQIMAAASGSNGQRGGYGQQPRDAYGSHGSSGNGNDLPFFDPAIMSMTRSQAQNAYGGTAAAAAHAHAINNFGARGSYGYGGGAGAFAPFDSAAGLHAGFGNQGEQQQRGGAPGLSPAYGYSTVS